MSRTMEEGVIDLAQLRQVCRGCSLRDLCLPVGMRQSDLESLEHIVHTRGDFDRGQHLFLTGDRFEAIYAVKNGAFKTYTLDDDGREHVLGFHLPGELIGLDGIHSDENLCNAVSLEKSAVCVLPFSRLEELARRVPGLQAQLLKVMSRDISLHSRLAGDHTAEERLAAFLVNMSSRLGRRGLARAAFRLFMPRRDIASHLRLAPETVSRLLARFQKDDLIEVHGKEVHLRDIDRLQEIGRSLEVPSATS